MNSMSQVKQSVIARFIERAGDPRISVIENPTEELVEAHQRGRTVRLYQHGFMGAVRAAALRGAIHPSRKGPKRVEENYLYASRYFAQAADNGADIFGIGERRFFQNAVGAIANAEGYPTTFTNLTELETNMDVGGQIAQGKSFVMRELGISFNVLATTNNVETLLDAGALRFEKQGGQFILRHGPARQWPGGLGVSGYASGLAAAGEASAHNGTADPRAVRRLRVPRVIKQKESFAYVYNVPRLLGPGAVPAANFALTAATSLVMTIWLWGHQVDQIPV
jgi:hypothetical protein